MRSGSATAAGRSIAFLLGILALGSGVCRGDEPPDYLEAIVSEDEFVKLTRLELRQSLGWDRVGNYFAPARDDEALLPTMYVNVNLHPTHQEFLSTQFPELFGGLSDGEYGALILRRGTRRYFAGKICSIERAGYVTLYGFDLYYDITNPWQVPTLEEVNSLYHLLAETFALRPLVFCPVFPSLVNAARSWHDADFPIHFYEDQAQLDYVPYTAATSYGRIRLTTAAELTEAEGAFSWQDILVLDRAPFDLQDVVAGVITGSPQGELSHLAIRMARRGTPNAYVRDAQEAYRELAGRLVRLTVGENSAVADTEVTAWEALAWWEAHRPLLASVTRPDLSYTALDHLLEMDTEEISVSLTSRFGGKAANLARMYDFLPAENQVPGFGIPFHYYQEFLRSNLITDDRSQPPVLRTYEEYLQLLLADPRFQSDAAYRSLRLEAFRSHARKRGTVDPALVATLETRIAQVFGSTRTMVRFRSSSNLEDSLVFNGAGLYSSTSVCAADSWDDDDNGPSLCWPGQEEERTIERGLKKVWASLWNYGACEERSYYQVGDRPAAMAILVTTAFPDEAANGVAFTGLPGVQLGKVASTEAPWPPSPSTYLVNVQIGDISVVAPESGELPERDLVTMSEGVVEAITRSSPSSVLPPGEWALSDEQLRELGRVMWLVDSQMPLDLVGYQRQDVLLDLEFKLTQAGALILKQVRPFLRTSAEPLTISDYYRLEIPAGTTLCGLSSEWRGDVQQEHRLLSQVDLVAGTIFLPRDQDGPIEIDLVAELRFGPQQTVAERSSRGWLTVVPGEAGTGYQFEQRFSAGGVPLVVRLAELHLDDAAPVVRLDDAYVTFHNRPFAEVGADAKQAGEVIRYSSCSCNLFTEHRLQLVLDDGTTAVLDLPSLDSSGANLVAAEVAIAGNTVRQEDYWHLVYAAGEGQSSRQLWVLLEEPLGNIHGLALYEEEPSQFRAAYLDGNLDELEQRVVVQASEGDLVPGLAEVQDLPMTVVPVVAHTAGHNGTRWVSDLVLHPVTAANGTPRDAFLYFLTDSSDPAGGRRESRVALPSAGSLLLADVVRSRLGHIDRAGALVVVAQEPLLAGSRTYNDAATGTFGQYIPAVSPAAALTSSDTATLIQLTDNDRFRCNLGLVNLTPGGEQIEIEIALYGADGQSLLGTVTRLVPGDRFFQQSQVFAAVSSQPVDDGLAVVRALTPSARFLAYASVVDAESGDPFFIPPSRPLAGATYLVAAAHAAGANDTAWRSDVELYNPGDTAIDARIELLWRGRDSSQPVAAMVPVAAGTARRLCDVIGDLLQYEGTAALRVTPSTGALHVTSRTYNDLVTRTFGQYIPGVATDEALAGLPGGLLLQLVHSPDGTTGYRTNIGLVNVTGSEIRATIELHDRSGSLLGRLHRTLPPFAFHQENDVFRKVTAPPIAAGSAVLRSDTTGSRFFAFASVVDNRSGDPVFIPARPLPAEYR